MANVLADLFQDTADAIRAKTGGTAKIAPADFPKEILSIATVINGGGETEGNLKIASGAFYAGTEGNNVRHTVTHGLGEMPDFVLVYFNGSKTDNNAIHLETAWGLNSKFPPIGAGVGKMGDYTTDIGAGSGASYGMDNFPDSTNFDYRPWITTPDQNTFEVGANVNNLLWPGGFYSWIALSGMGATAESAENLSF